MVWWDIRKTTCRWKMDEPHCYAHCMYLVAFSADCKNRLQRSRCYALGFGLPPDPPPRYLPVTAAVNSRLRLRARPVFQHSYLFRPFYLLVCRCPLCWGRNVRLLYSMCCCQGGGRGRTCCAVYSSSSSSSIVVVRVAALRYKHADRSLTPL